MFRRRIHFSVMRKCQDCIISTMWNLDVPINVLRVESKGFYQCDVEFFTTSEKLNDQHMQMCNFAFHYVAVAQF